MVLYNLFFIIFLSLDREKEECFCLIFQLCSSTCDLFIATFHLSPFVTSDQAFKMCLSLGGANMSSFNINEARERVNRAKYCRYTMTRVVFALNFEIYAKLSVNIP